MPCTASLCFMNCYYIHINIDMKTTAKRVPGSVKVSVLQQGLQVSISASCVPICLTPYISYKTPAPRHLPAVQPETSCNKNLAPAPRPHATVKSHNQARGPCITTEQNTRSAFAQHLYTVISTREGS